MSVDQLPRHSQRPDEAQFVEYDEYIDRQIQTTRRAVKLVDFATALVNLVIGTLAFLFAIALVEHWLLPSGFSSVGRGVLFVLLVGSAGYYAYQRLWPLVVRSINPVYAAQTIEQSSPSLKNSLINLLLFRTHRAEISDAVYKTLEEQAAQRLTRVPVEAAVDRSQLIRLGYVLLAMVAIGAIYKVVSPKDPLITAGRILLPWADIVPASRVQISTVAPGHVTVARGEFVTVSAEVRGVSESDPVLLRYTTADGQAVGQSVAMRLADGGLKFECRLPDAPDSAGAAGVAQNLTYRIEAGDARSLDYTVTVVTAPSILVERVDYDYPAYTGFVDRSIEKLGDIRAIEGTRVTVHARANGSIKEAMVDFDADGRRDLTMTANDTRARAEFVLALRDDGPTPLHSSYVLRFTNGDGRTNRDPVKHPIDVLPDYAPEVAMLAPAEKTRDVRIDEQVMIEIEARDPDFALAEVRLRGEVAGRSAIDNVLLAVKEHTGRFTTRYEFTPGTHNLRVGDVVEMWAVANDNRLPQPHSTATDRKTFRIVSPSPTQEPPPDRIAQRDQQPPSRDAQRSAEKGETRQNENTKSSDQQTGKSTSADGQTEQQQQQPGNQAQPGNQDQNDKQTGAGAAGGETSESGSQPDGARPDEQQQPGGSNSDHPGSGGNQKQPDTGGSSPISSEGDNDAEAFERIRRHLQQQSEMRDGEENARNGEPQNDDSASAGGDKGARDGESPQPSGESTPKDGGPQPPSRDAQRNTDGEFSRDAQRSAENGDTQQSAGEQPSENQGTPNSQPEAKPTEKGQQRPSTDGQKPDDVEPPAGARGKRESDSQGEQGGDMPGGGEEGAGQKAPREGTGSAGQNQSADEGAGESSERGPGNDSPDAGQDALADRPTGQPGSSTPGEGDTQRDGQSQESGGEFSRDAQRNADQRDVQRSADGNLQPSDRDAQRSADGSTPGDGGPRSSEAKPDSDAGATPAGDEANLEYSRKQTDLVLEKLSEQLKRKRVDQGLLDKLGWSPEELERFVARWQQLKQTARGNDASGDAARLELDAALRSLGLRPGPMQQSQVQDDAVHDLSEGYRGNVPLEYQERLRAYNQGVSRSRQQDE